MKNYSKKILIEKYKKIIIVLIMIISLFVVNYFLNFNIKNLSLNEMIKGQQFLLETQIINEGNINDISLFPKKKYHTLLWKKMLNYQVDKINPEKLTTGYYVYNLTNLEPNTTYTYNLSFDFYTKNDKNAKLVINAINQTPSQTVDQENKKYMTNIDPKKEGYKELYVLNGFNRYQMKLEVTTDAQGMVSFVIGLQNYTNNLDFNISNLTIKEINKEYND